MVSKKLFSAMVATAVILSIVGGSSVAFAQTQTTNAAAKPTQTIAQITENNTNLTTLVSLLKKTNLTDVLSGPGNYTLFAPDNAAFAKVNASTLANLQNNSTALTTLLLYHVIPAKLLANNFTGSGTLTTVNGLSLPYSVSGTTIMVGNATVTKADINATNGVIHIIDSVLVPPSVTTTASPTASGGFLGLPGFEAVYAVAGLLAVAYLVMRRRK
ncbi:MAG: fasciclin domain-containing protein [Halobacteriota archaeon]|jgi:PGF-CTERM protein